MPRPSRSLCRKRVALQTQQVHLAHTQKTRIGRSMRRVTAAASLCLHRNVFVYERPCLVGVTLGTDRVSAWQRPYLAKRRCSMHVVAITASDKTFVHTVVIRLSKVCFGSRVAPIAETGLRLSQQMLWLFSVVRRMAVQAANVIAGVRRRAEVSLLMLFTVAGQATCARLFPRHRLEADNFAYISAAFYVCRAGAMTCLAPVCRIE